MLGEWLEVQAPYVKFRNLINGHIIPSLGKMALKQVGTAQLTRFIHEKAEYGRLDGRGGLSNSTLQVLFLILKSSLEYAVRERYIAPLDFTLKCPEVKRESAKALTVDEQAMLERSLRSDLDASKLGILLCLYTGLRIGEVCALHWRDISFEGQLICVRRTVQRLQLPTATAEKKAALVTGLPKSKCSLRRIPIPQCLTDTLLAHRRNPEVYILSEKAEKPMEPRTYQYRFERYITTAGISDVNFHVLRHTFATRLDGGVVSFHASKGGQGEMGL